MSPARRPQRGRSVVPVLLGLILLLGGGGGGGCGGATSDAPKLHGYVRTPSLDVGGVTLPDVRPGGSERSPMRASPDGLLLVYFGYTSCPDVCPTTLSDIEVALGELRAAARERVRVAMVTIDPARDLGEVLTHYVQTFVPGAHALRTEDAALLARVADRFGASYSVERGESGAIEVSHTAFVYAVDDAGLLRLQWPFGTTPVAFARDVRALLDGFDPGGSRAADPDSNDQEVS